MRQCLLNKRLQWFGHLERMEQNVWSRKYWTFTVSGNFFKGQPRKTWKKVIRSDLKESKVCKNTTKDINIWKSFIGNRSSHNNDEEWLNLCLNQKSHYFHRKACLFPVLKLRFRTRIIYFFIVKTSLDNNPSKKCLLWSK